MNSEEAKQFLVSLLMEQKDIKDSFKRNTYQAAFEERYETLEPDMLLLEEAYIHAENKDDFLADIAQEPAASAKAAVDAQKGNRKKNMTEMNYSLTMVTFVLPYLLHYGKPVTDLLTDKICEAWGETFPKSKIKKATFEEINGGFRRKWCYITTAVCESCGKPDDCYELTLLRDYRDNWLAKKEDGPELIRTYYDVAPTIVKRIDRDPASKEIYDGIYRDYLLPCITMIEQEHPDACMEKYRDMVFDLKKQYLYS